jgi:GTPase SAR1 family protein
LQNTSPQPQISSKDDDIFPWNRSKLVLVGEKQSGKTTFGYGLFGQTNKDGVAGDLSGKKLILEKDNDELLEYSSPDKSRRSTSSVNNRVHAISQFSDTNLRTDIDSLQAMEEGSQEFAFTAPFTNLKDSGSTGFIISLSEFGSTHFLSVPYLITKFGVYVVVFDMEEYIANGDGDLSLQESYRRQLKPWLDLIAFYTYDQESRLTAPIIIVGTKGELSSDQYSCISTLLLFSGFLCK